MKRKSWPIFLKVPTPSMVLNTSSIFFKSRKKGGNVINIQVDCNGKSKHTVVLEYFNIKE